MSISGNLGMNILKFLQKKFFEKICKFFFINKMAPWTNSEQIDDA